MRIYMSSRYLKCYIVHAAARFSCYTFFTDSIVLCILSSSGKKINENMTHTNSRTLIHVRVASRIRMGHEHFMSGRPCVYATRDCLVCWNEICMPYSDSGSIRRDFIDEKKNGNICMAKQADRATHSECRSNQTNAMAQLKISNNIGLYNTKCQPTRSAACGRRTNLPFMLMARHFYPISILFIHFQKVEFHSQA